MASAVMTLVSVVFLFLIPCVTALGPHLAPMVMSPITITVVNSITRAPNKTFSATVAKRGLLRGAMIRLADHDRGFRYSIIEHEEYGVFLRSINGVLADHEQNLYWRFWVQLANGSIIKPNVGFACYMPNPNDNIIFVYDQW